ncbi:MAG: hypothetical protein K2G88_01420, partial [Oscillospiraceae bacterium]|nr:hypothetical protein [Oscillospiraceae bacterium]
SPELASNMIQEIAKLLNISINNIYADYLTYISEISNLDIIYKDACFLFQSDIDDRIFIILYCKKYSDLHTILINCPIKLKNIIHESFLKYQILTDRGFGILEIQKKLIDYSGTDYSHKILTNCINLL